MKVFITNKERFDSCFTGDDHRHKSSSQIHKDLYNQVMSDVADGYIPLCVLCGYKEEGFAIFDFISKKGEFLFYEYATTVS